MKDQRHISFLDGFRGVAILAVLSRHILMSLAGNVSSMAQSGHHLALALFLTVLHAVFEAGTYGVATFFVVSGFCIHLSYRRSQEAGWLVFFTRRLFRIYPAYLASLVLFLLILPSTRWAADQWASIPHGIDLVLHLCLAHNLVPQAFETINGAYWSLAIEFQLYLLFPLLLMMTGRIGWRQTLVVTAVTEVVTRLCLIWAGHHEAQIYPVTWFGWNKLSPLGFWFSWTLGAVLAEAYLEKQPIPFARGPLPLWMWPLLVILFDQTHFLINFAFPMAAFGTARFMAWFLVREESMATDEPNLAVRALRWVGVISYSLYLIHQPLYYYMVTLMPVTHGHASGFVVKFFCLAGAMLVIVSASYLCFRFVETPGIEVGKRIVKWMRRRREAEATGFPVRGVL